MGEPLGMVGSKSYLVLFLVVVVAYHSVAFGSLDVPAVKLESEEKLNVFDMKKKLEAQNRELSLLSKEVNNVEISIGMNNKKYYKLADERAKLEESLTNAKRNADFDGLNLKKNYNHARSLLMGVLLNKLENTENSSDMLARKIMISKLQERLLDLDGMMKSNKSLQVEVERLNEKLTESMNTEKELLGLMGELEERKKELKSDLELKNKSTLDMKTRLDEEKNKMAMNQKSQIAKQTREKLAPVQITEEIRIPSQPLNVGEYYPPLYSYHNLEYQKKGVTFNFVGKNEVRATKAGKIVYTGALASYGNVLMIDHGNDTRTVLLGQFDYAVKNGDVVKDSQVVGYTNPRSNSGLGEGRIYFEVRKNNLAQNTYMLLDKKSLARNSTN
jgi:murein DD-endopeptidase MepM/ murein hydrolase activator NlpD